MIMGGCYSNTGAKVSAKHKLLKDVKSTPCKLGRNSFNSSTSSIIANGDGGHSCTRNNNATPSELTLSVNQIVPQVLEDASSELAHDMPRVVPSDSGIESLDSPQEITEQEQLRTEQRQLRTEQEQLRTEHVLCRSCHQKLQRLSCTSCSHCGNFRILNPQLNDLQADNTYCTCGPRWPGKRTSCQTHRNKNEVPGVSIQLDKMGKLLKPNFKKLSRGDGKRAHLSWLSADNLDVGITESALERPRSEVSETFRDDISFRAPLAHFDSVDYRLDRGDGRNGEAGSKTALQESCQINMYSDVVDLTDYICKCDVPTTSVRANDDKQSSVPGTSSEHSPVSRKVEAKRLEKEDDNDSGHEVSKSENHSESMADSDLEESQETDQLLDDISLPSLLAKTISLQDMKAVSETSVAEVSVDGHRLVVMDADTYTQMLNDLSVLRTQLGQLTEVIQSDDEFDTRQFSFKMYE